MKEAVVTEFKSVLKKGILHGDVVKACEAAEAFVSELLIGGNRNEAKDMLSFLIETAGEMEERKRLLSAARILKSAGFLARNILGDGQALVLVAGNALRVEGKASEHPAQKAAVDMAQKAVRVCLLPDFELSILLPTAAPL